MNTLIFDLDGTLLPMQNVEIFLEMYFAALTKKLISLELEPKKLTKAVWVATGSMVNNDGTMTNEKRFWEVFCSIVGEGAREIEPVFVEFYRNEFEEAKIATSTHPLAAECIRSLKLKGYQVILATNPLFPRIATYTRIRWAGLDPENFSFITTYENSSYCKPNLQYYKEVLNNIGRQPNDCMMVGNDVKEDMCASLLGMETFLLKDCMICGEGVDITGYRQGNFNDLYDMIRKLPNISNQ